MKALFFIALFLPSLLRADYYLSDVPYNNAECRRAFLLGMGSAQGALLGKDQFYGFWPHEEEAWKVFMAVAKLYAADIGVEPELRATDAWQAHVAVALARSLPPQISPRLSRAESVAYMAGAYARWGTPAGLRLNSSEAYEIAQHISFLNDFNLELKHRSGVPGGYTLTITDGGGVSAAEFFKLMQKVKADVQKATPSAAAETPAASSP